MFEKEISIQSGEISLAGTLCLPEKQGKYPVVLMVHGSGPLDRNENLKGQELNIFNTIAHHLANQGIASIRYDKRGCGKSEGKYYSAGHFDLVDDAINCFDSLDDFECVDKNQKYILGHSEGCIIAAQMSIKRKHASGMILLCPFVKTIESILREQAKVIQNEINSKRGALSFLGRVFCQLFGSPVDRQNKLINKIKHTSSDSFFIPFRYIEAKWLRELFTVKPIEVFSQVSSPMLALAGEKDLQCSPDDVGIIAETVHGRIDSYILPNLTHILRYDEKEASFNDYFRQMRLPVEPDVLGYISDWLTVELANKR